MTKEQLAVYAKLKMRAAMGAVMSQSTVMLTLSEVLELMGVPELVEAAKKDIED
jgi:hypothetical protein